MGYDANVTKQVVFQKNKDGIDEVCVDTTPAQGLICPEVKATEEEAASLKAARERSLASQIRFLENQVRKHNADRTTLKRASDARQARTAGNANPRAYDRKTRKRVMSAQAMVGENATSAWLYYKNLLKAKKAELDHLLHGTRPTAETEELSESEYKHKLTLVTAIVQQLLNG